MPTPASATMPGRGRSLNRDQVDLDQRELSVVGKGLKVRLVFLTARAALAIVSYLAARRDNTTLFVAE
jgi:site-specific recombinase XerC